MEGLSVTTSSHPPQLLSILINPILHLPKFLFNIPNPRLFLRNQPGNNRTEIITPRIPKLVMQLIKMRLLMRQNSIQLRVLQFKNKLVS